MYFVGIIFVIYCLLKMFFYGLYELKTLNNKVGGISICILSVLSSIFTCGIIIYYYMI